MKYKLKLHSVDVGYCRVYYTTMVGETTFFFCFQNEGGNIKFYKCIKNIEVDIIEPDYGVKFSYDKFEIDRLPEGNDIAEEVRNYLNNLKK